MRNFSILTRKETRRLMFGHVTRDAQGEPLGTLQRPAECAHLDADSTRRLDAAHSLSSAGLERTLGCPRR